MAAQLLLNIQVNPADIDDVEARCQATDGGNLVTLQIGELRIQSSGDGCRNLIEFLHAAAGKVEKAHRQWLVEMAERNAERMAVAV